MKKLKKCRRDLRTMGKPMAIFGTYDSHNMKKSRGLSINELDIIEALIKKDVEIDFKKEYGVDYNDFVYEDKNPRGFDWVELKSDNTYNWSSQVTINFSEIEVDGVRYVAVKFHRYGDVRGNYTDYCVLDMTLQDFLEFLLTDTAKYMTVKIQGKNYGISQNPLNEACVFDVWSNDADYQNDHVVLLDLDNLASKREVTKALRDYLKNDAA